MRAITLDATKANVSLERAIGTTMSGEADDEEKARQWEEVSRNVTSMLLPMHY